MDHFRFRFLRQVLSFHDIIELLMTIRYETEPITHRCVILCFTIFVCAFRFAKYSLAISARCFCAFVNSTWPSSCSSIVHVSKHRLGSANKQPTS